MATDRITSISIAGMRSIKSVQLPLDGLTVLIGDNGAGKSTILEAFELLRQAAKSIDFVPDILERGHGGLANLLRRGSEQLTIGVTVQGAGPGLMYSFSIALVGTSPQIIEEHLDVEEPDDMPSGLFWRLGNTCKYITPSGEFAEYGSLPPQTLGISQLGVVAPNGLKRLLSAFERIECHVPFETRPLWQQRELEIRKGPRWPDYAEPATKVSRFGVNLPNCFQEIRNAGNGVWNRVLDMARLGIGEDLRDIRIRQVHRGQLELELVVSSLPDKPLPLEVLSEGQLAFLAFIAMTELNRERSALVFDEPEQHLHPALLARVVGMLEETAESAPVVIATHSDRLLDCLSHPAESVVLCELDECRSTQLRHPNAEQLNQWLEQYRGIGSLRAEGYEGHVFDRVVGGEPLLPIVDVMTH
jgi:predicted ATPase